MGNHTPVMLSEVLSLLGEGPGSYIDCTFGRGGYTEALLKSHPKNKVWAIDRDPEAISWGMEHLLPQYEKRLELIHDRFSGLKKIAEDHQIPPLQGIVFDLGVSSPQLDEGHRGFSFMRDGPLNMGMGLHDKTAADFLNQASQEEITSVLRTLGEERYASRVAREILKRRITKPFETTEELATLVKEVIPRNPSGLHPATRTFQALRLWVNEELTELSKGLEASLDLLAWGGILLVVSFHSLEDRIVKHFFQKESRPPTTPNRHALALSPLAEKGTGPLFELPRPQPLRPSPSECQKNPRARSARLRYGIYKKSEETA
ncbi:MAG: 16S rRNA (cytosine(1402)-N(4))-methyltransferase RsmH [Holosporales bacterium]|nr:16S rRNA (cytosine(1402)-N(4))-methyltransferase RsmH [Holosporales bacterium]